MSEIGKQVFDPLQHDLELGFTQRFYPLGFPLILNSNSHQVMEAAAGCWGAWNRAFDTEPIRLNIVVSAGGSLAMEPSYRAQGHLMTIVSDSDNHACLDLDRLFGFGRFTEATAADHTWMRWHFLEALANSAMAQRYVVPLHAGVVARNGRGVLLYGPSTAGKSTLAFACARAGWTFVSDDAANLVQDLADRTVIGNPAQARFRDDVQQFFPEVAGFAIRARPHGKLSIEVPLSAFPEIRTAQSCEVACTVAIGRGGPARIDRIASAFLIEELTEQRCFYGYDTRARHERAVRRLLEMPAYRMVYQTLDEAIGMLEGIIA